MEEKMVAEGGDRDTKKPAGFNVLKAWLEVNKDWNFNISDEEILDFLNAKIYAELRYSEDYSNYESSRSRNGGNYGFWTVLERMGDAEHYRVVHHTTADLDYCGACGSFQGHDEESCRFEEVDLRTTEQKRNALSDAIKHHEEQINRLKFLLEKCQ